MVEIKGELKFKKVDDLTIEVSDDENKWLWTRETLGHALNQIEFETNRLSKRAKFYKAIISKADDFKIKTEEEVAKEKAKAEAKLKKEKKEVE